MKELFNNDRLVIQLHDFNFGYGISLGIAREFIYLKIICIAITFYYLPRK